MSPQLVVRVAVQVDDCARDGSGADPYVDAVAGVGGGRLHVPGAGGGVLCEAVGWVDPPLPRDAR
jgi:hypothetical protein